MSGSSGAQCRCWMSGSEQTATMSSVTPPLMPYNRSDDVNTNDAEIINLGDDPDWNAATKAHLLPPTLQGFSFASKKWGEFSVDKLRPVIWEEAPFQHLVLADSYREVVRSLIEVHSSDKKRLLLNDVVQGKSSGCIIALYGNPGCGKVGRRKQRGSSRRADIAICRQRP